MRAWLLSSAVFAIVACSKGEPPAPPTVTGTLVCQPDIRVLGATLPDEAAETESLQREVVASLTDPAFVHRVAVAEHLDEAALTRALSVRPVHDARLVAVSVALPDRALATSACDALLAHYVAERQRQDVTILDHCGPPPR